MGQVGLFVQRPVPRTIYVVKNPPFTTLFAARVLPILARARKAAANTAAQGESGGRWSGAVVYVGGGGLDGSPDGNMVSR